MYGEPVRGAANAAPLLAPGDPVDGRMYAGAAAPAATAVRGDA